jgi:hypothetical protein
MFALDDVAFLGSLSTYDPDALAYIRAVEIADTQELEPGVRTAINDFVIGCKTDNIWSALKATCILAGARTLAGALVPLVGAAPTNFNFAAEDYNRKTGLPGDGSTKYLNSNRNNNSDPQDNKHLAVYVTDIGSLNRPFLSAGGSSSGASTIFYRGVGTYIIRNNASTLFDPGVSFTVGFIGSSRSASESFIARLQESNYTASITSQTPFNENYLLMRAGAVYGNGRAAFYSIGEDVDLALLDARVTALLAAIDAAIP